MSHTVAKFSFVPPLFILILTGCLCLFPSKADSETARLQSNPNVEAELQNLLAEYQKLETELNSLLEKLPAITADEATLKQRQEYSERILYLMEEMEKLREESKNLRKKIGKFPKPPVLRLAEAVGPTVSRLGHFQVEYSPGQTGFTLRKGDATTSVQKIISFHLSQFPKEIVMGEPFQLQGKMKIRYSYRAGYGCQDFSARRDPASSFNYSLQYWMRLGAGALGTRDHILADDLQTYCNRSQVCSERSGFNWETREPAKIVKIQFVQDDECNTGATDKESVIDMTLKYTPVKTEINNNQRAFRYRMEWVNAPNAAKPGPPATRLEERQLFWDQYDPQKGYSAEETLTINGSLNFGMHNGLSWKSIQIKLIYKPEGETSGPIPDIPPYQQPPEFSQPPRDGINEGPVAERDRDLTTVPERTPPTGNGPGREGDGGPSGTGPGGPGGDGPIDPNKLDPDSQDVAGKIREWIGVAEPPRNVTEGAKFRYEPWGRMVGTTADGAIITATAKPGFARATPEETVWSIRQKLDSVNHCTVEEYVLAKLQGKTIGHCQGRYKAPPPANLEDFSGMTVAQARKKLAKAQLKSKLVVGKPAPSKNLQSRIASQKPGPGARMKPGQTVELSIYGAYDPLVRVPDLTGLSIAEARAKLKAKGIDVGIVAAGPAPSAALTSKVKEVDPKPGAKVQPGAKVTIKIYGPYNPLVKVPDVTGMSVTQAKAKLKELGLNAGMAASDPAPSADLSLKVKQADPETGTEVKPGTRVTLKIYGKFNPLRAVPNVAGMSFSQAKTKLTQAGFAVSPKAAGGAPSADKAYKVARQEPGAGQRVAPGSLVKLSIFSKYIPAGAAAGSQKVRAPNVTGLSLKEAKGRLARAGLSASPTVAGPAPTRNQSFKVKTQTPAAGTLIQKGSGVKVALYGKFTAPAGNVSGEQRGKNLASFDCENLPSRVWSLSRESYSDWERKWVKREYGKVNLVPVGAYVNCYIWRDDTSKYGYSRQRIIEITIFWTHKPVDQKTLEQRYCKFPKETSFSAIDKPTGGMRSSSTFYSKRNRAAYVSFSDESWLYFSVPPKPDDFRQIAEAYLRKVEPYAISCGSVRSRQGTGVIQAPRDEGGVGSGVFGQ